MKKEKIQLSSVLFAVGIAVITLVIVGILAFYPRLKNQGINEGNILLGEKPKDLISTDDWLKFETSAPFTFSYPTTWGIEAVPDMGNISGVHAVGPEGEIFMYWGDKFGGDGSGVVCDDKAIVDFKLGEENVKFCNEARSDGTEHWRLISKQVSPAGNFDASASAKAPADQNRDMILKVFSTVKFNPENK